MDTLRTLFTSYESIAFVATVEVMTLAQKAFCQSQLLWNAYTNSGRIHFDLGKPPWTLDAPAYSCLGWFQLSYIYSYSALELGEHFSDRWLSIKPVIGRRASMPIWGLWIVHIGDFSLCMCEPCVWWNWLYSKSIRCSCPGYINRLSHPFPVNPGFLSLVLTSEYWVQPLSSNKDFFIRLIVSRVGWFGSRKNS